MINLLNINCFYIKIFNGKLLLFVLLQFLIYGQNAIAAASDVKLRPANTDITNIDSIKRGATEFNTRCIVCHSVKYMRLNRIAKDINVSNKEIVKIIGQGRIKPTETISAIQDAKALKVAYGVEPPDLSLITREKGVDYVYSFLTGFYIDEQNKENNYYLANTVMPNIMAGLQNDNRKLEQVARDITAFLEYSGEPAKLIRLQLGWKVILFLIMFTILAYFLKKEYWRDIKKEK